MRGRFAGLLVGVLGLRRAPRRRAGRAPRPRPRRGAAIRGATAVPVFAYYYIWFDPTSWDRAKRDLPLAGKYSSNDATVMRRHIEWAKQAGITGFIVSWKHTPSLDRRLATLIDVAESEHFSLAMIYQGLDFYRHPVPADRSAPTSSSSPGPSRSGSRSRSSRSRSSSGRGPGSSAPPTSSA